MKKSRFYLLIFVILIVFLLTNSCSMRIIKIVENKKRLRLLTEEINKYNSSINSFRGIGYAILKNGKTTKSFRLDVIFDNDFKDYKILVKDFIFKKPIAVLLKREDGSILLNDYLKRAKTVYSNASDIFNKVLGIEIPEGNLFIQTIGLRVPILNNTNSQLIETNSVQFYLNKQKEIIAFQDGVPETLNYIDSSNKMIITFSKLKEVSSVKLPSRVLINLGKTSLEIDYKELQINGDFTSEIKLDK